MKIHTNALYDKYLCCGSDFKKFNFWFNLLYHSVEPFQTMSEVIQDIYKVKLILQYTFFVIFKNILARNAYILLTVTTPAK